MERLYEGVLQMTVSCEPSDPSDGAPFTDSLIMSDDMSSFCNQTNIQLESNTQIQNKYFNSSKKNKTANT